MPETIQSCARAGILMRAYYDPMFTAPESDAGKQEICDLINGGAIERVQQKSLDGTPDYWTYQCTPLGRAWVRAMLATPLPRVAFVDAAGQVIPE